MRQPIASSTGHLVGAIDLHAGHPSRWMALLLLVMATLWAAPSFAQTCDLEITSQTGFSGSLDPTDMEFTFRNTGPDTCTGTSIRMPVNFPGTTPTTFTNQAYNVYHVNYVDVGSDAGNGFCSWSTALDQVDCTGISVTSGQSFRIQLNGYPIPNPTQEGCISAYWHPGAGVDPDSSDNPHESCYPIGQQTVIAEKTLQSGGIAGQQVVFEMRVINNSNIHLTAPFVDTPPSGMTYHSVSGAPGVTCTAGTLGGAVTCNHAGGWPPGTTTFQMTFNTNPSLAGQWVTNVCTVNADGTWIIDDTACQANVSFIGPPTASKSGPIGSVGIGENFVWTITVNHQTTNQIGSFDVVDSVPSGFTIVSAVNSNNGQPCSISGQTVTCSISYMASSPVVLAITVTPTTPGTFTNTCTIDGVQPTGCSHTVVVEEDDQADIEATKTSTSSIFWPGQPITYTISVTNHGPDDAAQVEVLDSLPFTSNTWTVNAPGASSCDTITPTSSFFRCWYPYLAVGQSVSLTLTGTVPSGYAQPTLLNRCQAGPSTLSPPQFVDPNSKNNAYDHCRAETPRGTPHVSVAKTAPGTAPLGDEFNYVLTAQNGSPVAISGVQVVDNLPAGVSFVSASANAYFTCSHAAGVVTCDAASMPPNAVAQITIRVRAEQPGQVTNTCQASFGGGTVDVSNCTTTTQVTPGTVTVSKADSDDPVWIDQQFDYLVRIRNTSGARADNVVVTDTLPSGLVFHSVGSPAPFACSHAAGIIQCVASQVAAGTDVTVPIRVHATQPGTVVNQCAASVGGTTVPGTCQEQTVVRNGTVHVIKSDSADPVFIGQTFDYVLNVTNTSAGPVQTVMVSDVLPFDVAFESIVAPAPFSCTTPAVGSPGMVACSAASLPVGYAADIVITVHAMIVGTVWNFCGADVGGVSTTQPDCSETTVVESVPFDVVKVDSADPVRVGEQFSYYLDWTYNGIDILPSASILDQLPMQVGLVSYSSDHAAVTCDDGNPTPESVACAFTNLQPGASGRIEIVVTAPDTAQQVANNCFVGVMGHSDYPVTDCNEITTVLPAIAIEKTDLVDPVLVGETVTYQITLTNTHPVVAEQIEVTDILPDDLTLVSASGDHGWTCDTSDPVLVDCVGDVPGNTTVTLTITAQAPSTPMVVTNICTARALIKQLAFAPAPDRSSFHPIDLPSDLCEEDTTIEGHEADLSAAKSGPITPVALGQPFDYLIQVVNNGPQEAINAVVTDTLPVGTTFLSAAGTGWTCSHDGGTPGVVTCGAPNLAVGPAPDIIVQVTAPSVPGTIENVCQVSSDTTDPVANPACSVTTVIREYLPVTAVKSDAIDPVLISETIQYTITVTNTDSEFAATDLSISDALPAGTTYVSANGPGWSCLFDGGAPGSVTCQRPSLAAGDTSSIEIVAQAPSTSGLVVNTCSVAVANPLWPTDSTACVEDTTVRQADPLIVTKTDAIDPVRTGQPVSYRIDLLNSDGFAEATDIAVVDTLPTGTVFQSASSPAGTCSHNGGVPGAVSCAIPTLAAGATAYIDILVTAPDVAGTLLNTCSATATFAGPVDSGGCSEDTTVIESGDLVVTKVDLVDPVLTGQPVTYRIDVTNTDSSEDATDVVVVDALPAGTVFQSVSSPTGTCSHNGGSPGSINCSIATLAAGATASIHIDVIAPDVAGTIVNTCTATATFAGSVDATGCTEDTTILQSGELIVSKADLADPVQVGEAIDYRITVANTSAGDEATDVVVVDALPVGTTFASASALGASCIHNGGAPGSVTCTFGAIAAGATATIDIRVMAPATAGTVLNTCTATATFAGSVDDSDCSESTTIIDGGVANLELDKQASPRVASLGDVVTWTITVTNTGDADANDVVVEDDVPTALTVTNAASSQGSCLVMDQLVRCQIGTVPAGGSATVTILTRANALGATENLCVVTAAASVPPTASRCGGTVVVGQEPVIEVSKSTSHQTVQVGGRFTWTVHVSNTGLGDAHNVAVTDAMPTGVEVLDFPAECAFSDPDYICTLGMLPAGSSTTLDFVVRGIAPGSHQNVCVVSYADSEGNITDIAQGCSSTTVVQVPGGSVKPVPINDPRALILMVILMLGMAVLIQRR